MEWHLVHGDSLRVGDYKVPVPSDWLVYEIGSGTTFIRPIDPSKGISGIDIRASGPVNLNAWAQVQKLVLEKQGVQGVEDIWLNTRDQPLECIGGDEWKVYSQAVHLPRMPSLVLTCNSPNELWMEFTGERAGLQLFSDLVSSISKQPFPSRAAQSLP